MKDENQPVRVQLELPAENQSAHRRRQPAGVVVKPEPGLYDANLLAMPPSTPVKVKPEPVDAKMTAVRIFSKMWRPLPAF